MDRDDTPIFEGHSALSPEARRHRAIARAAHLVAPAETSGRRSHALVIARRVATGVYSDGFIHAGNFAYMALLSLFPFFIAATAIFSAIGEQGERAALIDAILSALPRSVASELGPVAHDVVRARQGWLLWVGAAFGLWTTSSLIETIRDILNRSYGTRPVRAFWQYRLDSIGVTFASVVLLLVALGAQVAISAVQQLIGTFLPGLDGFFAGLLYSRIIAALTLFGSLYLLFVSLTPHAYQGRHYPKWPGALFVTTWWTLLIFLMPLVLGSIFKYNLTYGSLAGVMITLFFFWLVGLGIVVGAELNAALAVAPEERLLGAKARAGQEEARMEQGG